MRTLYDAIHESGLTGRDNAGEVVAGMGMADALIISPPAPGGPCYVVTREAAETVDRVTAEAANGYEYLADKDRVLINVRAIVWAGIAALLGNVRRAKAVGEFNCGGTDSWDTVADPVAAKSDSPRALVGDRPGHFVVIDGDTVAVLEED